jgi:hypothetical protein
MLEHFTACLEIAVGFRGSHHHLLYEFGSMGCICTHL